MRLADNVYQIFYNIETKHWWFVARRRIILSLLRFFVKKKLANKTTELKICDMGTGCGATLLELSSKYSAVGIDKASEAVNFSRQRGVTVLPGELPDKLPFESELFDAILVLDVLEHIADDRTAVRNIVGLLKKGGLLFATVPAYPWLWTKRDVYHEHKRRYTRTEFIRLFQNNDLAITILSYFNCFLFIPAALIRIFKKYLGIDKYEPDVDVPSEPFNTILRSIFLFEAFFLPYLYLPFGLSMICVARKK